MGGEVVRIAAGSRDHINAMDMVDGYGAVSYTHLDVYKRQVRAYLKEARENRRGYF